MANPDRMTVQYEWVVEQISEDDDIIECHYWPEREIKNALRCFMQTPNPDFGLCRRKGSETDGEVDRQYVYADTSEETWVWPSNFDGGANIPLRLQALLPERI